MLPNTSLSSCVSVTSSPLPLKMVAFIDSLQSLKLNGQREMIFICPDVLWLGSHIAPATYV